MLIASAIVSGLGLGSMYGLLALGFHVTHAVSRTVNLKLSGPLKFASGE